MFLNHPMTIRILENWLFNDAYFKLRSIGLDIYPFAVSSGYSFFLWRFSLILASIPLLQTWPTKYIFIVFPRVRAYFEKCRVSFPIHYRNIIQYFQPSGSVWGGFPIPTIVLLKIQTAGE